MTSLKESSDVVQDDAPKKGVPEKGTKDFSELPPSGTSLHKRRRGEGPATLSVKTAHSPSDEGSSPCTAAISTSEEYWSPYEGETDPEAFCETMIQILKDRTDLPSIRGRELAVQTKEFLDILDQFESLLDMLDKFTSMKEQHGKIMRRLRDVNQLQKIIETRKKIDQENERILQETKELQLINEALDADLECEYGNVVFNTIMSGRTMKRSGSKWKGHAKFGGSLLKKQRSRSAGGEDSDISPGTPLRRMSDGLFLKDMEKSKVSKWTRVKAAFRWEKAQWPTTMAGASAVAAGAMVGAVALAGSSPSSAHEHRDAASLTPGSMLSLTPNSSSEELRLESGSCRKSVMVRCDENDNTFLHAPVQDDSSTSPSPNKMHKSPWLKMRDIISTHRDSVRKKHRGAKVSPDVVPCRRRSFSDGADSDVPPALTVTIPSSEELESDPHPVLRKQRSLELGARPPQHRAPRPSKWTKVKRAFLTSASASVPSSPSRHSAFFTDADTEGLSSGCEASGVREEIARDYAALQTRLGREFQDRRGKLYASCRPVATEEQLSADFRKKLAEWQRLKGERLPPPVPARQDLSDDFLKKWDEWKKMKETNSVPTWEKAKPDEVLVETSTGLFKFKGISRSFTRKLYEWEKSKGIAPEARTSALLKEARDNKIPLAPLMRTQSDGSVAPTVSGVGRLHASSLSVNDADDFESDYEGHHHSIDDIDECDGEETRGAVLVEVEAEEVCTAAPLVAMTPKHTPQKPVYTYGHAEARLLCETSSTITGTAVLQPNGDSRIKKDTGTKPKSKTEKSRKKLARQPSIEEDAMFIRKTIEEIERCSNRFKEEDEDAEGYEEAIYKDDDNKSLTNKVYFRRSSRQNSKESKDNDDEDTREEKRKEDKNNCKKKSKSRARLEREQSKPSESDTEQEVDTVTVEIPRRRKRPRRQSEKPKTPPTSLHSDTEEEVFVLKLKATEVRDHPPDVIVKTTRKIFSPVIRSGETVPKAVIPVDVEDLDEVRPSRDLNYKSPDHKSRKCVAKERGREDGSAMTKGSGDLQEYEEQRPRSRPPLPLSPSSQRKPQPKETSPSIRIMIQRYNKKITEEGHTSPVSSGASSPAWRSPISERRRPPDMPVGVNIKNNPFLEKEVQKSASACQLFPRDQISAEKRVSLTPLQDGVLKSHSANVLHLDKNQQSSNNKKTKEDSQETICSTDTNVQSLSKNHPEYTSTRYEPFPVLRQMSESIVPTVSRFISENAGIFERSISVVGSSMSSESDAASARVSERAARIRAARERFLTSPVQLRRQGTYSAYDLRPSNRLSNMSCESEAPEPSRSGQEQALGRSASTGMVNVDREAWQRVAEGPSRETRSRFSLARLAAKLRRKDDGASAVSRLCRQSLLVQLRNKY